MSLDWSLTEIDDYKNLCWLEIEGSENVRLNPITESIIWATMVTGIGHIKDEDTAAEFVVRYRISNGVRGSATYLSYADVVKHIGLRTNVGKETRAAFMKRVNGWMNETAKDLHKF